ncbi:hypothetical protein IWX75_002692 [Arthrobacter sp. CAN_A6]
MGPIATGGADTGARNEGSSDGSLIALGKGLVFLAAGSGTYAVRFHNHAN